jgi:hypothetical protein
MVDDATATMIANLPARTGRDLDAWFEVVAASGLDRHGQILAHLKTEHGVSHGYANLIALLYAQRDAQPTPDDLVARQYEGPKAGLRPVYERLVAAARALGADVEIAPKKTSVSLRRHKQFGLVTPATRSRIDLGLNLPGEPAAGRLEATTGMCTHRIGIERLEEVDDEVLRALRRAYDRA